jgi:DNA-binding NtrC family response regulator
MILRIDRLLNKSILSPGIEEGVMKKTIFIIEDDNHVLSMMKNYFEYLGYNIITALNGLDGLKMVKSENFDLVITDIVMPHVSGLGIISVVKEKSPDLPVIAITAYGRNPERIAAEKKADVVLRKPFEMEQLKDHVVRLIGS